MNRKYTYVPFDTLVFKEYSFFSEFWKVVSNTKRIKPLTYVEFQMTRLYYSFDEIIDAITELCIKGHWRRYRSLYEALNALNVKDVMFYERNNKGNNSKQGKFIYHRKGKRTTLYRKEYFNEAIRTLFY